MAKVYTINPRKYIYWFPAGQAECNSQFILNVRVKKKFGKLSWYGFKEVHSIDTDYDKYTEKEHITLLLKEYDEERKMKIQLRKAMLNPLFNV